MPVHAGASYPTATWRPSGWGSLVWSTRTGDSAAHGSRPSHGELCAGNWQLRGARVAKPEAGLQFQELARDETFKYSARSSPCIKNRSTPAAAARVCPALLATPGACCHTGRVIHSISFVPAAVTSVNVTWTGRGGRLTASRGPAGH